MNQFAELMSSGGEDEERRARQLEKWAWLVALVATLSVVVPFILVFQRVMLGIIRAAQVNGDSPGVVDL